MNYESCTLYLI